MNEEQNGLSRYDKNDSSSEKVKVDNIFYFTQGRANSDNDKVEDDFFESNLYKKIKALCEKEPYKVFRVIIDQGYIPDEDFKYRVNYYRWYMTNVETGEKIPENLIIDFSGSKETVYEKYTPRPFVDADKEWYKIFKAECENDPNTIHTITIDEGNRDRGEFLESCFNLSENLPDNARIIINYNKEHDVIPDEINNRFKKIDLQASTEEELKTIRKHLEEMRKARQENKDANMKLR